jgi:hypothetical protein
MRGLKKSGYNYEPQIARSTSVAYLAPVVLVVTRH